MKKILPLLLLLATLFSCSEKYNADGSFTINGTAENADGKTLYLVTIKDFEATAVDSATISDGKFTFDGKLDAAVESRLLTDSYPLNIMQEQNGASLYLEPTTMTLTISDITKLADATLTGSATQAEVDDYIKAVEEFQKPMMELNKKFYEVRAAGDTTALAEIEKQMAEITPKYQAAEKAWFDAHPQSYFTFQQKSFMMGNMSLESVDSLFSAMPEKFKGTEVYNSIETELNTLKAVAPGAQAPEFSATDMNGEKMSLSQFKGHYVILDFWATWCVPCRASMPHVKALYDKYKDKGLEVVCVSDDDGNEAKWKEAVEKDQTGLFHHVLRGLKRTANGGFDKSTDISEKYAIHYLPTKFLIDPDGKIVNKVDDEQLEAELKKAYGF